MRSTIHRTRRTTIALAAVALVLAACGGTPAGPAPASVPPATAPAPAPTPAPEPPPVEPVTVVVTTSILGDLVAAVVGEAGTVQVLMPTGADPHDYRPSAADAAAMRDADLVVAVGLGLEEGLIATLDAARADGVRVLEVAPDLDPIPFTFAVEGDHDHDHDHAHGEEEGDDHAHDGLDPHFWFDPLRSARAAELVAAELTAIRPGGDWAVRAAALRTDLEALDAELSRTFSEIPAPRRRLVTNHDAFAYLADRYGFEVVGAIVPGSTTTAATDARAFARLADLLVREGIDVVFAETIDDDALAQQLAAEVSRRGGGAVRVVTLYTGSLGPAGSGAETYAGMLRTNAALISGALGQ